MCFIGNPDKLFKCSLDALFTDYELVGDSLSTCQLTLELDEEMGDARYSSNTPLCLRKLLTYKFSLFTNPYGTSIGFNSRCFEYKVTLQIYPIMLNILEYMPLVTTFFSLFPVVG